MSDPATSSSFSHWLPTVVTGGALILIWADIRWAKGQFNQKAETLKDDFIKKTEEIVNTFRKALYHDDGTTVFAPTVICERERNLCRTMTCSKLDALNAKMISMDAKRERSKDAAIKESNDIKNRLSSLETSNDTMAEAVKDMKRTLDKLQAYHIKYRIPTEED